MRSAITSAVLAIAALSVASCRSDAESPWTRAIAHAAFSPRYGQASVAFNDRLWAIAGYDGRTETYKNDVWSSENGVDWVQVKPDDASGFPARASHGSVVFDDAVWVIGGFNANSASRTFLNDVWRSADGISWTAATLNAAFSPRANFGCVVFDGRIWVIGGDFAGKSSELFNDVWYSADGATWQQATAAAAFSPRQNPVALSFDGKLWVAGGGEGNADFNDVWRSENGASWSMVTGNARFPARQGASGLVFNGLMWVIAGAGYGTGVFYNDAWFSPDGSNWTQSTGNAGFRPREGQTGSVFGGRMWIIGGYGEDAGCQNDVWFYP